MLGWIITGVIAVLFIIMAIFLLNGKGAFLIAGYNTMSDDKKAAYNEKALCKAVGWLMLVLTVLMMFFPVIAHFEIVWLFWVEFALIMAVTFGFAIYANTGNRFRKEIDPDLSPGETKSLPISKGKKLAIIIGIVLTVQICIGVGVMIYQGERDPVVSVRLDSIRISAMYGLDINYANISEIILIDKSMKDIGIGSRINGYSSGGQALKGHFSSAAHGQQLLFVYSGSSPTIRITRVLGEDIFISFRSSDTTKAIYSDISAPLS